MYRSHVTVAILQFSNKSTPTELSDGQLDNEQRRGTTDVIPFGPDNRFQYSEPLRDVVLALSTQSGDSYLKSR